MKHRWILIVIIWATILTTLGFSSVRTFPPSWHAAFDLPNYGTAHPFFRWDTLNYSGIATHGYTDLGSAAFFPGYPLLLRGLHTLVPLAWDWLAPLLSFSLFLGGVLFLLRLKVVQQWRWERRLLTLVLVLPSGFVFVSGYSESLFWFATGLLLWSLERQRSNLAILGATIAAVTRPFGFLFSIPLIIALWQRRHWLRLAATVFCIVLPLAVWNVHLERKLNVPLAPYRSQIEAFSRSIGFNTADATERIKNLRLAANPVYRLNVFNQLLGLLAAAAGLFGLRRVLPRPWFWTSLAVIVFIYGSGSLHATNRQVFSLIPIVLGLTATIPPLLRPAVIGLSAGLLVLNTIFFSLWFYLV